MLTELRIAGLGVIGDAALELGAGFTAVTVSTDPVGTGECAAAVTVYT